MPRFSTSTALLLSLPAILFTSCRKPEIRAYLAPKDPEPAEQHTADDGHDHGPREQRPRPKVTWTLPDGWREAATGEVSVAAFAVKTDAGEASVTITPLPNLKGQEALVVNMYRQQAGLSPLDQGEIGALLKPVDVAGGAGQLLELDGTSNGKPVRILTAIAHRDGQSWFYRIAGDQALVTAQKPAFLDFLKTVKIEQSSPGAEVPAAAATAEPAKFNWPVPQGWMTLAAGQMQVAKFAVPERDGAKAEVSVSIFPSDTGGTLANVNRWRKQLGLAEVDDAGLAALVTPLDPNTPNAQLVTLTNENRALLGAIVPRGSEWWFYKMMGDAPAVSAERDSFVSFAKAQP
jgi:hypothetical protein